MRGRAVRDLVVGALCAVGLGGCAAPPAKPDPEVEVRGIHVAILRAPRVVVEIVRVNDVVVPEVELARSLARFETLIGVPLEVVDHGRVALDCEPDGRLLRATRWPVTPEGELRPPLPPGHFELGPEAEPAHIRVLFIERPAREDIFAKPVFGFHRRLPAGEDEPRGGSLVVIQCGVIADRTNAFIPYAKALEWTITHELGHAIDVPADPSRAWQGPGFGTHCTRPECVMYTGRDWRLVWTAMVRGWPMDYCGPCRDEVRLAREAMAD